jgi:hypothetical protein
MNAYGWSYCELADTRSDLTDCLKQYVDLDQLAHDLESNSATTDSLRYTGIGEGLGGSRGGYKNKRRPDGYDDEKCPVKQAQRFKEPEVSTIICLWPTPGEPEISKITKPWPPREQAKAEQ